MTSSGGFVREKMRAYAQTPPLVLAIERRRARKQKKKILDKPIEETTFREFCALLEIRTKAGTHVGFAFEKWHPEQIQFDEERTGHDLVLKPRQVGFSTLELARDLHYAIVHSGGQVLIIVHESKLADQLFITLQLFAEHLKSIGLLPATRYSNKREIVFRKGSAVRIEESGGSTESASKKGRSGTVHRLHATELAFWPSANETMRAVLGSVPTDGEVVIESTPNGVGNLFHEDVTAARTRDTGYKVHFFAWYNHPTYRIPVGPNFDSKPRDDWEHKLRAKGCNDEQIAFWRSKVEDPKMGLEAALQEFPIDPETCFRSSEAQWIDAAILDRIAPRVRKAQRFAPISWKGARYEPAAIFEEPVYGLQYVVGGDVSEGVANDGSSASVLERASGRKVATWWSNTIAPGDFGVVLCVLGWMYNTALVAPERNNHGHATLDRMLTAMRYPRIYMADDGGLGWSTNSATRPVLWDNLAFAIRDGAAWTPDPAAFAELRTIIRDKDGQPRARGKGAKNSDACRDDRFVSWGVAWQLRSRTVQIESLSGQVRT